MAFEQRPVVLICRYVRHSDMVLDLDELGGAVQNALDLIEIAEFERRAHSGEAAVKQMEN